jgi:hypothetical protein
MSSTTFRAAARSPWRAPSRSSTAAEPLGRHFRSSRRIPRPERSGSGRQPFRRRFRGAFRARRNRCGGDGPRPPAYGRARSSCRARRDVPEEPWRHTRADKDRSTGGRGSSPRAAARRLPVRRATLGGEAARLRCGEHSRRRPWSRRWSEARAPASPRRRLYAALVAATPRAATAAARVALLPVSQTGDGAEASTIGRSTSGRRLGADRDWTPRRPCSRQRSLEPRERRSGTASVARTGQEATSRAPKRATRRFCPRCLRLRRSSGSPTAAGRRAASSVADAQPQARQGAKADLASRRPGSGERRR